MSHPSIGVPRRARRRRGLRASLAVAVLLAVSVGTAEAAPFPTATPAATATFANFTDADGGTLDGVGFSMTYDFVQPSSSLPPDVLGQSLDTPDYDPPGSSDQPALRLPAAEGAVVITFDSPVTNFSLYPVFMRLTNSSGPESYNLVATGSGAWTVLSGDGVLNGTNLTSTGDFISGVITFAGTVSEVRIETLGSIAVPGSIYGLGLATVDGEVAAPTVASVSPNEGPTAGGTILTIEGSGFGPGTSATIGGAPCTEVSVISETAFTCVAPAGTVGAADLIVTTLGGSVTSTGAFTYTASPGPDPDPGPAPSPDPAPVTPSFTG